MCILLIKVRTLRGTNGFNISSKPLTNAEYPFQIEILSEVQFLPVIGMFTQKFYFLNISQMLLAFFFVTQTSVLSSVIKEIPEDHHEVG